MSKVDTMTTWMRRVWAEEDEKAIYEMFVPELDSDHAYGLKKNQGLKPADFVDFQKALLNILQDVSVSINSYIENDDYIFADCTMTAKKRNSVNPVPVRIEGCVYGKIKDGKIIAAKNYFDFLHLFEQLGLLPDNTFARCLSGEALK